MHLRLEPSGNILFVRLSGNLSTQDIDEFFQPAFDAVNDGEYDLIVSLRRVTYLNSMTVSAIARLYSLASNNSRNFRLIISESGLVNRVLNVAGIDQMVITCKNDVEAQDEIEALHRKKQRLKDVSQGDKDTSEIPVAKTVGAQPKTTPDIEEATDGAVLLYLNRMDFSASHTVREMLATKSTKESLQCFLAGLSSTHWMERLHCLKGLLEIHNDKTLDAILPLLTDPHPLVRLLAVEVTYQLGSGIGGTVISESLLSKDAAVREKSLRLSERLSSKTFDLDVKTCPQEKDIQMSGLSEWLNNMENNTEE